MSTCGCVACRHLERAKRAEEKLAEVERERDAARQAFANVDRERAEEREAVEVWANQGAFQSARAEKAERERDALRKRVKTAEIWVNSVGAQVDGLLRERDTAREALRVCREALEKCRDWFSFIEAWTPQPSLKQAAAAMVQNIDTALAAAKGQQ